MPNAPKRTFLIVAGPDVSFLRTGAEPSGLGRLGGQRSKLADMLLDERAYDLALIEARYADAVRLARARSPQMPIILLVDSEEGASPGLRTLGDVGVDAVVRWQDPPEIMLEAVERVYAELASTAAARQ